MKKCPMLLIIALPLLASSPSPVFADAQPKKGEISMERARSIALKKVAGEIKSSEYEFEKNQNVYSFDINGRDGKTHEILVSAKSGKIVSSTIESASKEASELEAEKVEKLDGK
jgi:hypothetical protein